MSNSSGIVAGVPCIVTPFRGDKFEAHWLPVAEAALDYGATGWALLRSKEGGLDFTQLAFMPSKLDFERYWYGDDFNDWRRDFSSWYQVPVIYTWNDMVFQGSLEHAANGGTV